MWTCLLRRITAKVRTIIRVFEYTETGADAVWKCPFATLGI